jgi:hypothetical protein
MVVRRKEREEVREVREGGRKEGRKEGRKGRGERSIGWLSEHERIEILDESRFPFLSRDSVAN